MRKNKKIVILTGVFLMTLNIVACGQVKDDEVVNSNESATSQQESNVQTVENTDLGIKEDETVNQQESNVQTVERLETKVDETIDIEESNTQASENIESEMTTEELFNLFINGSISAISSADSTSTFYITDLDMDSDEWDSFSIGEQVDLDNDGENELIICGSYGGIYLDARDNKVYEFAAGEEIGYMLSYVVYDGATWIMYSNRMHTGYEAYHMEKFEGADNLVAEMNFYEELVDEDNVEGKEKYTLNGTEIFYDEYFELCSKIFATEVTTTK